MFKFIHAADLHLDSPLQGLERYEGAPVDEIRGATRRALENLVDLAIRESVHFVLIAGDLYDGDWKDASTGLFFVKQMSRLRQAGIPVYVIAGNHDAQNKMTKELRFPSNVTMFSAKKSATAMVPSLDVAIHGQSYATADVRDNLAEGYPDAVPGAFNIGLLHTCGPGTLGHAPYAPCSLPQFAGKGYQYWALGHVHTRQDLIDDPPVIFPGNIQGRHIGETGPHGCLLVQVDERHRIVREFVSLDVLRWYICDVDATGAIDSDAVIDRFGLKLNALLAENPGTPLAIRVVVSGATDAHRRLTAERRAIREKIQGVAMDLSNGSVWVEKLILKTQPELAPSIPEGPVAEVKAYLEELRADAGEFESLRGEITALREFLPADLIADCGFDEQEALLDDAEALLMDRLLRTEAAG